MTMASPQIERANIVNLDWALAHMDVVKAKKARRKSGTTEDWVYEAEMKDIVEDVSIVPCPTPILKRYDCRQTFGDLVPCFWTTVCATLMSPMTHDYIVPGVPEVKEDSVSKILERRGIKYSHRNDDILVPNTIEEQQMKKARKVRGLGIYPYTISSHSPETGKTPREEEREGTGYIH